MNLQTACFYNLISPMYPIVDVFLKPQKRRLFLEINALPGGDLLEIGVGNGLHLQLYERHKVVGIDISSKMLEQAMKFKSDDIELFEMNGENILFPAQSFDYVILSHVVAVADNPERILAESFRVLKPGGKLFILNHFTPANWLRHIDIVFHPLAKKLHFRSAFYSQHLHVLKQFTLSKEIKFGPLSYFKLLIFDKA